MYAMLALAVLSLTYMIVGGLIPLWVIGAGTVLALILTVRPLLKVKSGSVIEHGPIHNPALWTAVLTLAFWALGSFLGW
jgi:hypothetical protein